MAKRKQNAGDEAFRLAARLILLIAILTGPAVAAWFNDRPWALPLAAATVIFGLAGLILFALALRQMQRQKAQRRRLLEQDWGRFSPQEFEYYVADLFRAQGWQAKVVGGTADGGVDIILKHEVGHKAIAQVKQYLSSRKVNVKEIREFSAVVARSGADEGYFVTAGLFTKPAMDWAGNEPMVLVDGDGLAQWAEEVRQKSATQPAKSGFGLVQWLSLAFLGATAAGIFTFVVGILAWG